MFDILLKGPANLSIRITSDSNIIWDDKNILLLHAYVPNVEISNMHIDIPTITINHTETHDKKFTIQGNVITIGDIRDGQFSFDMYHLLYSLFHEYLLKHYIYSIHAICVLGSKRILLVGHSGVGKSTISLDLAASYNMSVVTGNKTLVSFDDRIMCQGGTTTMTLPKKYSNFYTKNVSSIDYYDRVAFANSYDGSESNGAIDFIVLPLLNNHEDCCTSVSPLSALHKLYSYFIDSVYKDTVMCGGKYVYTASYTSQVALHLIQGLQKTLFVTPVYQIHGSKEYISSTIASLC